MPPVEHTVITVEGRFDHHHRAERGTVSLTAGFEGGDRASVVRRTTELHAALSGEVQSMHAPGAGPVTWWSSDRMRVWSSRPWNQDGKQLPLVHHCAVTLEVKFSDLDRLATWLESVSVRDGVTVGGIDWTLTVATRTRLVADSRHRAVQDAVAKAGAYATSLGLAQVRPLAVADPGMLGDESRPTSDAGGAAMLRSAAAGGPELQLKPADITIEARVHARFAAS